MEYDTMPESLLFERGFLAALRWMELDVQKDVKDERRKDNGWCDKYKEDLLTMRLAYRAALKAEEGRKG